jgi:polygalacturonase
VGDGKTDDTAAMRRLLQSPCDALPTLRTNGIPDVKSQRHPEPIVHPTTNTCPCHKHIVIPKGTIVVTYPLNMTSHMTLQVDGILQAIASTAHWPILPPNPIYGDSQDFIHTNQYQGFLYAEHARNIRVTGSGVIDGNGPYWWDLIAQARTNKDNNNDLLQAGRPNLFQTNNCSGIEMNHVTMKDAAFWTVHPMLSRDIHIHYLTIRAKLYAPNVDGIDPDSCQNVMVEYNDISCGDDHIAIKSGVCGPHLPNDCRDADWHSRVGHYLTWNVTIRHNIFRTGMDCRGNWHQWRNTRHLDIQ